MRIPMGFLGLERHSSSESNGGTELNMVDAQKWVVKKIDDRYTVR